MTYSDKDFLIENKPVLKVELMAEKDTIVYSEPINLSIILKNTSDKTIYIPHNFLVVSNLLPNGLSDKVYDGGIINFDIQPVSSWAKLYIEDIVLSKPREFIKIKPGQIQEIKYNFGLHLKAINDLSDQDDSLFIQTGKTYKLQVRYENFWENKKRKSGSFVGSVQSNQISIFLKED